MKIREAHRTQYLPYNPPILLAQWCPLRQYIGGPSTKKKIIGAQCLVNIAYWRRGTLVRQYSHRLKVRCPSPIFKPIAYKLRFTNRKRKYFEEKTSATLKSKQTSIATVRNHLRTLASFPTPLIFHWSLPLSNFNCKYILQHLRLFEKWILPSVFFATPSLKYQSFPVLMTLLHNLSNNHFTCLQAHGWQDWRWSGDTTRGNSFEALF